MMASEPPSTPPRSRNASRSSIGKDSPPLKLDFSDLPPLITPSPPSNTLLITNLQDPEIFTGSTLAHLRDLITKHSPDDIHTFSPLRSFHRIVVTFYTTESAIAVRSLLDGESFFNNRIRCYFSEPTPIKLSEDRHLRAPKAQKQFLISPPPSPPHGWEHREEDPPNKEVHAEDLADALQKISARKEAMPPSPASVTENGRTRQRSGSLIVFDPEEHGTSPDLPAISVEDTSETPDEMSPTEDQGERKIMAHTARPPVELMSRQ